MKNSIKALVAVLCLTAGSTAYASDDLIQAGVYQNRLDTVLLNYENGKHKEVYPDLLKYAKWGEKIPQYLLASMYLKGEGVDQDIKEAYLWLKVAVEQEDRDWLASLRAIENVLPADFKEAVKPEVQAHIEKYGVANTADFGTLLETVKSMRSIPDDAFSEELVKKGIKGVKYRAAGSRGASVTDDAAKQNYVIFDEKLISIMQKYGIVAPVAISAQTMVNTEE